MMTPEEIMAYRDRKERIAAVILASLIQRVPDEDLGTDETPMKYASIAEWWAYCLVQEIDK